MNPGDQNQNSSPDPPLPTEGVQAPIAETGRRSQSKIGRLPKVTRDKLNFMIRDGVPYNDIRSKLGDELKDITARNISGWQSSPHYQHWLLEQDWIEDLRDHQESAFDLLTDFDASKFNAAVLQLAVTRLFGAFRHLESGSINDKLGGNARIFANLVHALARASRETTNIEKYRDACAKAVTAELKQMNIDRELSDNEYQLLVNKMDRVFKVARRPVAPKPAEHGPVAPKPSEDGPAAAHSAPPNNGSH